MFETLAKSAVKETYAEKANGSRTKSEKRRGSLYQG